MTLIRTHLGVSLDGFIADADGLPAWDSMPTWSDGTHGHPEFIAECSAIAMGRTTFDQGLKFWLQGWPWPGRQLFVLTSRPLEVTAPSPISTVATPTDLARHVREAGIEGDVQLLGGAQTVRSCLDAGVLDRLGMVVLPVMLGAGVPLFKTNPMPFSQQRFDASMADGQLPPVPPRPPMSLHEHTVFPDGAIHVVYTPATSGI